MKITTTTTPQTPGPKRPRPSRAAAAPWLSPFAPGMRDAYVDHLRSERFGNAPPPDARDSGTTQDVQQIAQMLRKLRDRPVAYDPVTNLPRLAMPWPATAATAPEKEPETGPTPDTDTERGPIAGTTDTNDRPRRSWITAAAGHGRLPPAVIQLLARASLDAYALAAARRWELAPALPPRRRLQGEFAARNSFAFGFVFENAAVLSFCGTDTFLSDMLDNVRGPCLSYTFDTPGHGDLPAQTLGNVHYGFAAHLDRILGQILSWLSELPDDIRTVLCTGHSLGGALAVICARLLHARGYDVPCVATFGAPACGGGHFAESYPLHDNTWRIVHGNDTVQRASPAALGFEHVGQLEPVTLVTASGQKSLVSDETAELVRLAGLGVHAASKGAHWMIGLTTWGLWQSAAALVRAGAGLHAHKMQMVYLPQADHWLDTLIGEGADAADIRARHERYLGIG